MWMRHFYGFLFLCVRLGARGNKLEDFYILRKSWHCWNITLLQAAINELFEETQLDSVNMEAKWLPEAINRHWKNCRKVNNLLTLVSGLSGFLKRLLSHCSSKRCFCYAKLQIMSSHFTLPAQSPGVWTGWEQVQEMPEAPCSQLWVWEMMLLSLSVLLRNYVSFHRC